MIDRGDIRQAIDRCSNIWASLPGAGYGQITQGWQPDCKIQRSGRNGQEIDVWAESLRLSPLWLSASSSACHGLLIITVITPLPTKPSATKARELKLANAAITDMQMRQWCCCAWCKIHEGVSWMLKLKWCSAWWCCRWSSSVAHQSSLSVSAWSHSPPPAWIMQPPRLADCRIWLFHPQRERLIN